MTDADRIQELAAEVARLRAQLHQQDKENDTKGVMPSESSSRRDAGSSRSADAGVTHPATNTSPLPSGRSEELDPGIRAVVLRLQALGFETTDSGDGVAKIAAGWTPYEEALPYPHVVIVTDEGAFFACARRLATVMPGWTVQANFAPADGRCFVMVMKPDGV